jgi:hypothetical protein
MVQVNPDPHAYGYVFIPINRILAMFSSREEIRAVLRELNDLGFDGRSMDVFVGEEGADVLDLSGERHGTVTRALRNAEALLVLIAGESFRRADSALRAGGAAVAVLMDGRENLKDKVVSVLKAHRGSLIRYFSRWTIEELD